jgi:hypothetical protein
MIATQEMQMSREGKEVPLETETIERIEEATGQKVSVKRYRRGVLSIQTSTYENAFDALKVMASSSPRRRLERLRDHLRNHLERLGLPTDLGPNWIKLGDGEWQPQVGALLDLNLKPPFSVATWFKRIEDLTEPLSEGRRVSHLLIDLHVLLDYRKLTDNDLWIVGQIMEHYFDYQVGGKINRFAITGSKAIQARKAGPLARRQRSAEAREIVRRHAEAYWLTRPLYKNHASNTAEHICRKVNEELMRRGLLSKSGKPLSCKTIADHISASRRGKKAAIR